MSFVLTPASNMEVDAIRRAPKDEIVELPTLELQTGSPPKFWKQLPGIGFYAHHLLNYAPKVGLGLQIKLPEDQSYFGALEPRKTLAVAIPTAVVATDAAPCFFPPNGRRIESSGETIKDPLLLGVGKLAKMVLEAKVSSDRVRKGYFSKNTA